MTARSAELVRLATAPADNAAASAPWPDLDRSVAELRHLPAPDFPIDVLGDMAPWVRDAADAKSAPVDFVAPMLLSAAGAMLANARRGSPWSGWTEPPIIWAALVGLPSTGKSPAMDSVADLLARLEAELNADWPDRQRDHEATKVETKAKRVKWESEVAESVKINRPAPPPPDGVLDVAEPELRRVVVNDATTERVARLAIANPPGVQSNRSTAGTYLVIGDRHLSSRTRLPLYLSGTAHAVPVGAFSAWETICFQWIRSRPTFSTSGS